MERFIIKEPRVGTGVPPGNQMIAFPANARSGNMVPSENLYYSASNFHQVQQTAVNLPQNMNSPHLGQTQHYMNSSHPGQTQQSMNMPHMGQNQQNMNAPHLVQIQQSMNSPQMGQTQTFSTGQTMMPQGHISGIDPRYLAEYEGTSTQYILTGQQIQRNQTPINSFGNDYQNRSFEGADRHNSFMVQQAISMPQPQVMALGGLEKTKVEEMPKPPYTAVEPKNTQTQSKFQRNFPYSNKPNEIDRIRTDCQNLMMTRTDKLKALNKGGPRAFSGPVEKILKWHKALQDIGILIIYETVGKCVSVRPGENCAKNLVVRDDNGPAIQVVYYEIDFMLPELKPPCTVRVVGRMMPGTCRLQAFKVRLATGDDVATLPRRAAVADHHVAKLCKEFGHNGNV